MYVAGFVPLVPTAVLRMGTVTQLHALQRLLRQLRDPGVLVGWDTAGFLGESVAWELAGASCAICVLTTPLTCRVSEFPEDAAPQSAGSGLGTCLSGASPSRHKGPCGRRVPTSLTGYFQH